MPALTLQGAFTSGELSPSLQARVDLAKYQQGCRTLRNFLVQPHGGAVKRPGFELLDALPGEAFLIGFVFGGDQAYALCFGDYWLEAARPDGFVLNQDGSRFHIESPYGLEEARAMSTAQSADVLFIACPGAVPRKLQRFGHDDWRFEDMSFDAPLDPPAWSDYAEAEETAFESAYGANSIYYRTGGGLSARYYLIGETMYRKLDPDWQEKNHQLAYGAGNAFSKTDGEDSEGNPHTYYSPINENLYRKTGAAANIYFVNGAKMSDGSASPAQLITPYSYYVTAVDAQGKESEPSDAAGITGPASSNWQGGDYIVMSWQGTPGAVEYRVYKSEYGAAPGYIATTQGLSFNDYNIAPSVSEGAPKYENPFVKTGDAGEIVGDYPGTVCFFEQRLVFASTPNRPQTIWMSKSGDYGNFARYTPLTDDAPIELTLASPEVSPLVWMAWLRSLILGGTGMEWEIDAAGQGAFSAGNARAVPQSYRGSARIRPLIVGNVLLHVSRSGAQVRSLQYDFGSDSYGGTDQTILAAHLFEREGIVDWAYQQSPDSIVWAARSDGALLGLTFQAEHEVFAWHRHDTQGRFVSVCCTPRGREDALFAVIERRGVFYLERMAERYRGGDPARSVFLDCALTYEGTPIGSVSGLEHLEGQSAGVFAEGATQPPRVVRDGRITLDRPASLVTVGLPYTAELETMPVEIIGRDGTSVGRKKYVNGVNVLFRDTMGVEIALNEGKFETVKWRTTEPYGKPPAPFSGIRSVTLAALAELQATVRLRSEGPTPVTVLAVMASMEVKA
ncbi:MAG: hypothetical protein LBU06_05745 [Desulfovibrio sp.]|nr:hypothetical protein [Desulfovibrio sp.]